MGKQNAAPPLWRLALAFSVAPLVASAAMAVAQPAYDGLPDLVDRIWRTTTTYALFGAYPTAIVFGVPAYVLLRQRLAPSLLNCTWVGAAVAAFPWVILGLLSNANYAYSNGHVTHLHGAKTLWGWIEVLLMIASMGLLGALAGSVFWFIAKWPAPMSGRSEGAPLG